MLRRQPRPPPFPYTTLFRSLSQAAAPPYGEYLCIEPGEVARIHGTSGTTGRPTVFGIGSEDWARIGEAHARILWAAGLRRSEEHTSELQSPMYLVCRLLLDK